MAKTKNDETYERGVKDGKGGTILDDLAHSLGRGWGESKESEIYDKGYDRGAEHRHDSGSSGDSSSGGSSDSICYITTACVYSAGLPDDCSQLNILRKFRDNVLMHISKGRKALEEYNKISPDIVQAINKRDDSIKIWDSVYNDIEKAVSLVKKRRFKEAFEYYKNMTLELKLEYLD